MNKDSIFVEQHKQMCGKNKAIEMLKSLKASQPTEKDKPSKVYLNEYGEEVHVNGPVVVQVEKPETLLEKIARFDRLAANVAANRALMHGLAVDFFEDEESEEEEEKAMSEIDSVDEFGESYTVKVQKHLPFAQEENSAAGTTNNVGAQQSVDGDEPSKIAVPSAAELSQDSDMLED